MKYVTKKTLEEHALMKLIYSLTLIDCTKEDETERAEKSYRKKFISSLKKDPAFEELLLKKEMEEEYFLAKVNENKKLIYLLPGEILGKIKNKEILKFERGKKEDLKILNSHAKTLYKKVSDLFDWASTVREGNNKKLKRKIEFESFLDKIVCDIREKGDKFIVETEYDLLICENCEMIKKEIFKINKWVEEEPFSPYTLLRAAELEEKGGKFTLSLLFMCADRFERKNYYEISIKCKNVTQRVK